ncbi:MAG: prephenate dehydratase [Methylobacillus sp.]|jgi:chorismate mutase/prephenate dehydratase|nr:prephenate dehydratase [Methylobacillus sp.]
MDNDLKKLRDQIDAIDDQMLALVSERARIARAIGQVKGDAAVLRPEREAQVLRRMQTNNPGPLSAESVARLYTEIMSHCRALEAPVAVAYLGPAGTFSEAAVLKRFGHASNGVACASIDEVFRATETGQADYGVVPVENSTEGAIGRTLDLLLQSPLKICGEVMLPVHQCLLSSVADMKNIRRVYSHPQSLAQCQSWLNANLPNAERVAVASNAEAARLAAEQPGSAAVAGRQAAERFALPVLAANIEDDARNTTRFLVIGDQEVAPSGRDKTSLVMSTANRPGAVHDLLVPLAKHGVSMTKLESRPARSGLWEYAFFVDIEGHQQDTKVATALTELQQAAAFLKVLGSYPAAV